MMIIHDWWCLFFSSDFYYKNVIFNYIFSDDGHTLDMLFTLVGRKHNLPKAANIIQNIIGPFMVSYQSQLISCLINNCFLHN